VTLWDEYEVFDPRVDRPLHEVSRPDARAHFDLVMATKEHRIAELKKLCNGVGVNLDHGFDALQGFNDWFIAHVEPDPARPRRARGRWLSLCHDLALYIGDSWIAKYSHLHWTLHTGGKRNVSYQRPVIAGFSVGPRYTVDLDYALGGYAGDVAWGAPRDPDFFTQLAREVDEDA
jgi:hypothetical protein